MAKGNSPHSSFQKLLQLLMNQKKKIVSGALKVNTTLFFSVGRHSLELKQMKLFHLFKWEVGKGSFQKSETQSNKVKVMWPKWNMPQTSFFWNRCHRENFRAAGLAIHLKRGRRVGCKATGRAVPAPCGGRDLLYITLMLCYVSGQGFPDSARSCS